MLKWLVLLAKAFVFLVFLGFALNNSGTQTLTFFFGYQWHAPLVVFLLVFFVLGVASSLMATFFYVHRLRRELITVRKELRQKNQMLANDPSKFVDQFSL